MLALLLLVVLTSVLTTLNPFAILWWPYAAANLLLLLTASYMYKALPIVEPGPYEPLVDEEAPPPVAAIPAALPKVSIEPSATQPTIQRKYTPVTYP